MLLGQPLHPLKHALQIFTDVNKRRVGRSLGRAHCKGNLVPSRKQVAHKPSRAKSSISSSKRVSNPLLQQDSTDSYRQHNSGCLYQQRGGDEVGLSVGPTVENPVLVYQAAGNPQGTSHARLAERDSRQAIQTWPDHSNRVVTSSRSVPSHMLLVASASSGPVCHQVQQQTATVFVTGPRSPGMGSGCTQPFLGGPGPIRLSTSSHLGQSGGEVTGLPLQQDNTDCPRTVFFLALGSGKRRSEIHAWLHKNIRHQSDWSKVSLYPSPSFLSKNQLAKGGPDSVAPVVIPALVPSLDKSLKGDRSLCPVRALHYYLDRTSDLRQNKELVFVSFKKGFNKDISPATISSWIKTDCDPML